MKLYSIKMFKFIYQIFVSTLMFFSSLSSVNPLECVSMNNQECNVRQKLLMLIVASLYFILLVLKQANVVVVVIILTIPMQKCVFLML